MRGTFKDAAMLKALFLLITDRAGDRATNPRTSGPNTGGAVGEWLMAKLGRYRLWGLSVAGCAGFVVDDFVFDGARRW